MVVSGSEAALIAQGRKTQVRKRGRADRPPYKPDSRQPVQKKREATWDDERERVTVCHVVVRRLRWEPLEAVTEADAKKEGHRSRHLFLKEWRETHGAINADVWVVEFEVDRTEDVRFLARPNRNHGDYTKSRHDAIDELEAVDEWTLGEFARDNEQRFQRRRERTQAERLEAAIAEAKRLGIDPGLYEASIEQRLKAFERALRKRAA